jgi:hypothetical protein
MGEKLVQRKWFPSMKIPRSKSLFKIFGWGEWKGIFLHSKEKSGGILCGFRAFLTLSVRKKRLSGALHGDFE